MSRRVTLALAALSFLISAGCGSPDSTGPGAPGPKEARSSLAHDASPVVAGSDFQQLIDDDNAFAFDLLGQLAPKDDGNVVVSPLSVTMALAMTYAGARGDTATQIAGALHFTLPTARLHPALNKLAIQIAGENVAPHHTDGGDKSVRLSLVNALWAQQDFAFVPAYLDTLAVNYDAGVKLVDFVQDPSGATDSINAWVAQQTNDRIQNLIPPGAITSNTRLVLTDALYFYGSWATPFDRKATASGTFHTLASGDLATPFMHQIVEHAAYAEGDGYQTVDLPYDGGRLSMRIVLPATGRFAEIRSALSASWLAEVDAAMAQYSGNVTIALPKFKFDWGTKSLVPALKALGMTDAFQPGVADLSGITGSHELYIADVLHKAFLAVDEDGTEAAAATAVIANDFGLPDPGKSFSVDRPFLFLIRDGSGQVLFAGQVTNPAS